MSLPGPDELEAFFAAHFPAGSGVFRVVEARPGHARIALLTQKRHLRPGNTVSGPTQMMLADSVAYVAVLASVGLEALAVTTSLSIDFLRKPAADSELVATAEVVKLGRRLVVSQVRIEAGEDIVATASVTYSRP